MARPIQYTNEQIKAALIEKRGLISLAAEKMGCNYVTVWKRVKRSKELQEVIKRFRDNRIDRAELALDTAIVKGEPWAVALVLKTLGKKRGYYEKSEMTINGEDIDAAIKRELAKMATKGKATNASTPASDEPTPVSDEHPAS